MPLYLTPDRFRADDYGVNLDDMDDGALAALLARASASVNAYCNVPTVPTEYDFRGGTVEAEQQVWDFGTELVPGSRQYFPRYRPLKQVDSFSLHISEQQYLTFDPAEVYVRENVIELVSLNFTSVGLFGAVILPGVGLKAPVARASYSYGWRFNSGRERLYISDANTYRAANQWWETDPDYAPTIWINGVETAAGFTVDYDEGTVTIDTNTATTTVEASYTYRLPPAIAAATGLIATEHLGERALASKGLYGLVELSVGDVRVRRDYPRAGVESVGISDKAAALLDPFRQITVLGG